MKLCCLLKGRKRKKQEEDHLGVQKDTRTLEVSMASEHIEKHKLDYEILYVLL